MSLECEEPGCLEPTGSVRGHYCERHRKLRRIDVVNRYKESPKGREAVKRARANARSRERAKSLAKRALASAAALILLMGLAGCYTRDQAGDDAVRFCQEHKGIEDFWYGNERAEVTCRDGTFSVIEEKDYP